MFCASLVYDADSRRETPSSFQIHRKLGVPVSRGVTCSTNYTAKILSHSDPESLAPPGGGDPRVATKFYSLSRRNGGLPFGALAKEIHLRCSELVIYATQGSSSIESRVSFSVSFRAVSKARKVRRVRQIKSQREDHQVSRRWSFLRIYICVISNENF